jgi:prevent-host-death family protein
MFNRRREWRTLLRTQGDKTMTTLTATLARKQLYHLLDDVADSHKPIFITGKRNSAVLISADDWRAIEETLFLESIPGMKDSIVRGMKTPVGKCEKGLDW